MNQPLPENSTLPQLTSVPVWSEVEESAHLVQFYEGDQFLLNSLSDYVNSALTSGGSCIVVVTQPHLIGLEEALQQHGHDLTKASASDCYIPLDASETLSKFMIHGWPDASVFNQTIGQILKRAGNSGDRRVRIYGEMVALLWAEGKYDAAIRLEELWNELGSSHRFTLCCGYPIQAFGGEEFIRPLDAICTNHSVIVPAESYTSLSTPPERLKVITALQQKAKSLEREIAERKVIEKRLRASKARYRRLKDQLELQLKEREELLKREQIARLEAQSANRMKDEFLATVSHELRTPLTSLFGWTRLLRSANLEPKSVSRALEAIERSVQTQRQLVEDLLDVSRIIAGKLRLQLSSVEMDAVTETAIEGLRPSADLKNISVHFTMDSKTAALSGDPNRLQQVIWNLLSNAIKFTPVGGRIDVRLHCTKFAMIITVTDTGEGISSDFLPYVFDRFRQADSTTTRKHGGLGLGLAIVKHLVDLHKGSVQAESRGKGEGATFTVRLPVRREYEAGKSPGHHIDERVECTNIFNTFNPFKLL